MKTLFGFGLALLITFTVWAQEKATVPGVVIDYSPAASQQYIGSPSIAVLPNGEYVASHDFFGPGSTYSKMSVFGSRDKGQTWEKRADLDGQWWSSLFVHKGALYLMGTTKEYGFTVIRRSTDGGRTWTEPRDREYRLAVGRWRISLCAASRSHSQRPHLARDGRRNERHEMGRAVSRVYDVGSG
ncbi:MAG: sialidase family protein [Blastocatellia bacterium]